jgi:hypothetical protein
MNKNIPLSLAAMLLAVCALPDALQAQTQTVSFEVRAINQMSVSGNPGSLVVSTATAGSAPTDATDATTTWAVTTNQTGTKVTAAIDLAMPSGVTLKVNLGAPTGATSAGSVSLGTTAVDLVTGITKLNASAKTVTYTLSATAGAGVVASASRTVTYTVVAGT